jgi:hypothetical protein
MSITSFQTIVMNGKNGSSFVGVETVFGQVYKQASSVFEK